jgi:acetylornithine deacetylase/succinyl-diaminopimelate desuccinylase-like protein
MEETVQSIFDYIDGHFDDHLAEVQRYLRQPSVSAQNLGMQECAEMTAEYLRGLGADARLVPLEGGHPVVYATLRSNSSDKTLLIYNMYDVQPPEPLEGWSSPPWEAAIVDGKIIARGAINTKGPLMAFVNAVQSIKAVTGDVPVNMMFVIDGEEELGSLHLPQFIDAYQEELKQAEAMYFHMPSEMIKGQPQVILGFKGNAYFELELKLREFDVHSATAPVVRNPVWRLVWALNSMKGADDRIVIDGFYDNVRPPSQEDIDLLPGIVDVMGPETLASMYHLTDPYRVKLSGTDFVREFLFEPTLNIDGIIAGYTEPGSKTIVPASAMAKLDARLVPDMTVEEVLGKIRKHLDKCGFEDVEVRFVTGYGPAKTRASSPVAQAAVRSIEKMGLKPCVDPLVPGSAPEAMFARPPLSLPFAVSGLGHGFLMHSPDEYFEVEGVRACEKSAVAFLYEYAAT